MPSYRFCRPDDVPLLIRAVNELCEEEHAWDVPYFRMLMREYNLWPSSCMLAFAGDGVTPIAVLLGCKRPHATLLYRLAVHPAHRGQGHGRHLIESLSGKLAVLGPERIIVELEESLPARGFFAHLGFRSEMLFNDFSKERQAALPAAAIDCIGVMQLSDLALSNLWPSEDEACSWIRSTITLQNCTQKLEAIAVATDTALEAALVYHRTTIGVELVRFLCADPESRRVLFSLLLRTLSLGGATVTITVPRVGEQELPTSLLAELGFSHRANYHCLTASAKAH